MGPVNLIQIDISEDSFEVEGRIGFDPSKLDFENPERDKMRQAVLKVVKKSRRFVKPKDRQKC